MAPNGKPLLDQVVMSDASLTRKKTKMEAMANRFALHWVTAEALWSTAVATGISAIVYAAHWHLDLEMTVGVFGSAAHTLTGVVLGMLLVSRVVLGIIYVHNLGACVQDFHSRCRIVAVLSCTVSDTLTISAGAENEKKAATRFRFELVRLLNLSFYCYDLMLQGMKLAVPPTSLRAPEGSELEGEVLSAVEHPTAMVCKLLAELLEQQRAAKRISNEVAAMLMSKLAEMLEAYHSSLSYVMAPSPVALTSFTTFFVTAWAYSAGALIALMEREQGDAAGYSGSYGLTCTMAYTAVLSLFIFGLYEAGKVVEAPVKALKALTTTEEMMASLSDDLASLVSDPAVPIFYSGAPTEDE